MPGDRLEARILGRAARCGLELDSARIGALVAHAAEVLCADPQLHLTAITATDEFLERHLGEAFEGAAMIDPAAEGRLLDLGSGNGYPGLPIAAARPDLRPVLAEASTRKAAFLRGVVDVHFPDGAVIARHVRAPADLSEHEPIRLLVSRAMGGWERIIPRLARTLSDEGEVLIWAGEEAERVERRAAWSRLQRVERRPLPGRERSWIWRYRRTSDQDFRVR